MSVFAQATFTGTGGGAFLPFSGTVGGSWSEVYGSDTWQFAASGTGIRPPNTGTVCLHGPAGTSGSGGDYDVQADFKFASTAPTASFRVVMCSGLPGAITFYDLGWDAINNQWFISRVSAGSGDTVATSSTTSLSAGTTYTLKLSKRGGALTASVNGSTVCTYTDGSPLAAGGVAVRFDAGTYSDSGILCLGFTATDTTGGPMAGTLSGYGRTPTSVRLSSTAIAGGTAPYSSQLHRSTTSGVQGPAVGSPVSGATPAFPEDTGLTAGTTYYYQYVTTDAASQTTTSNQVAVDLSAMVAVNDANIVYPVETFSFIGASTQLAPFTGATAVGFPCQLVECRFAFTVASTGHFTVNLDTSRCATAGIASGDYPGLELILDGVYQAAQFTSPTVDRLTFGGTLAAGDHTAIVRSWLRGPSGSPMDSWTGLAYAPVVVSYDLGAGNATRTPIAPILRRPKNALFYGDSITNGAVANQVNGVGNYLGRYLDILGRALDVEVGGTWIGTTAFSQDGMVGPGLQTVWNLIDSLGHTRTFAGIDLVWIAHGTNDLADGVTPAITSDLVQARMEAFRAANASMQIVIDVPLSNSHHPANAATVQAALRAGFAQYQAAHPADNKVFLVDLPTRYPWVSSYLDNNHAVNFLSSGTDTIHPGQVGHAYFGAMKVAEYVRLTAPARPAPRLIGSSLIRRG